MAIEVTPELAERLRAKKEQMSQPRPPNRVISVHRCPACKGLSNEGKGTWRKLQRVDEKGDFYYGHIECFPLQYNP